MNTKFIAQIPMGFFHHDNNDSEASKIHFFFNDFFSRSLLSWHASTSAEATNSILCSRLERIHASSTTRSLTSLNTQAKSSRSVSNRTSGDSGYWISRINGKSMLSCLYRRTRWSAAIDSASRRKRGLRICILSNVASCSILGAKVKISYNRLDIFSLRLIS